MSRPMAGRTAPHGFRNAFVSRSPLRKFSLGFPACRPNRSRFGNFSIVMASVTLRPNRKSSAVWQTMPSRYWALG